MSLVAQRDDGVNAHGAASGNDARGGREERDMQSINLNGLRLDGGVGEQGLRNDGELEAKRGAAL